MSGPANCGKCKRPGAASDTRNLVTNLPVPKRLRSEGFLASPVEPEGHLLISNLGNWALEERMIRQRERTQLQIQSFSPTYISTRTPRSRRAPMYNSVGNIWSNARRNRVVTSMLHEEKLAVSEGSTPIVLRMSGRSRKEPIFL